jgi:hypothetical protein
MVGRLPLSALSLPSAVLGVAWGEEFTGAAGLLGGVGYLFFLGELNVFAVGELPARSGGLKGVAYSHYWNLKFT